MKSTGQVTDFEQSATTGSGKRSWLTRMVGPRVPFLVGALTADGLALGATALYYWGEDRNAAGTFPLQVLIMTLLAWGSALPVVIYSQSHRTLATAAGVVNTLMTSLLLTILPRIDLNAFPAVAGWFLVLASVFPARTLLGFEAFLALLVVYLNSVFPDAGLLHSLAPWAWPSFLIVVAGGLGAGTLGRWLYDRYAVAVGANAKLRLDLRRLTDANIGFQEFSSLVAEHARQAERSRISREIHDTAGYALTTLRMTFQAAKATLRQDVGRLEGLLNEGIVLSKDALTEIRSAMKDLRDEDIEAPRGMTLVVRLVRNFEQVTGIKVGVELSNTRQSYGYEVDSVVYKMVQESLVNSFRHGMASEVRLTLVESSDALIVSIEDNGKGVEIVELGIGLKGMEERVAALGGQFQFTSLKRGFQLTSTIPLDRNHG